MMVDVTILCLVFENFFVVVVLKIYLLITCKYTVADFRHTRRGWQISLWVVVSHHVVAGFWTQDLRKGSQCNILFYFVCVCLCLSVCRSLRPERTLDAPELVLEVVLHYSSTCWLSTLSVSVCARAHVSLPHREPLGWTLPSTSWVPGLQGRPVGLAGVASWTLSAPVFLGFISNHSLTLAQAAWNIQQSSCLSLPHARWQVCLASQRPWRMSHLGLSVFTSLSFSKGDFFFF